MALGKQIKHYREKAGWQFNELADASGVEVGTLNALEKRDSARSKYLQPIAQAFGLTIEQLTDEAADHEISLAGANRPDVPAQPSAAPLDQSDFAKTLAAAFDCLPANLELRAVTFTACMKILKEAGVGGPSYRPVPAPLRTAPCETPPG